ncbi:tetratricopeptide repeat protein [Aliikangiella sp. IMCC44632]
MFRFSQVSVFALAIVLLASCATGNQQGAQSIKASANDASSSEPQKDSQGAEIAAVIISNIPDPMSLTPDLDLVKAYDEVDNLLSKQQFDQAIASLKSLKLKFPQSSGPHYRLARIYMHQSDFAAAVEESQSCINVTPNNYYCFELQGLALREQGQFAQAKAAYQKAIEIYPNHATVHLNLGILADIYLYDFELALQHYQQYLLLSTAKKETVNKWIIDLKRRMN